MCCRVCEFRVTVWQSYKASRNFKYGYKCVTELPEVPDIVARAYTSHRIAERVKKNDLSVTRVLWHGVYIIHRSTRYGYECPAELAEVRVRVWKPYRTSRSSGYCGTGVQTLRKFQVRV